MKKRVLLVEDDALVGLDLADQLDMLGHEVLGPFLTSKEALTALATTGCDLAILDINLGTGTTEEVVVHLTETNIPFVITSGYEDGQWPAAFRGAPSVGKPVQMDRLAHWLDAS